MPLAPTRRERLRLQTLQEIKQHALVQLLAGGPDAVSLNGIARELGMSVGGLYRYYASRDHLLAALAADGYDQLAGALAGSIAQVAGPQERLRTLAHGYRAWALGNPGLYQLMLASNWGSGRIMRDLVLPGAHRAMGLLLETLADAEVDPADPAGAALPGPTGEDPNGLRKQLQVWAEHDDHDASSVAMLQLGVIVWGHWHGLISLELSGVYEAMGLDPAQLYSADLQSLLSYRRPTRDRPVAT